MNRAIGSISIKGHEHFRCKLMTKEGNIKGFNLLDPAAAVPRAFFSEVSGAMLVIGTLSAAGFADPAGLGLREIDRLSGA